MSCNFTRRLDIATTVLYVFSCCTLRSISEAADFYGKAANPLYRRCRSQGGPRWGTRETVGGTPERPMAGRFRVKPGLAGLFDSWRRARTGASPNG